MREHTLPKPVNFVFCNLVGWPQIHPKDADDKDKG